MHGCNWRQRRDRVLEPAHRARLDLIRLQSVAVLVLRQFYRTDLCPMIQRSRTSPSRMAQAQIRETGKEQSSSLPAELMCRPMP